MQNQRVAIKLSTESASGKPIRWQALLDEASNLYCLRLSACPSGTEEVTAEITFAGRKKKLLSTVFKLRQFGPTKSHFAEAKLKIKQVALICDAHVMEARK